MSELFGEDAFTALSYGRPYVVGMGRACVEHDDQGEGKRTPAAETAAAKKAAPARRSKTVRSPAVPTPAAVAASGPEDVPTSVFSSVVAERAMRYRTFRMIGTDEPNLDGPPNTPLDFLSRATSLAFWRLWTTTSGQETTYSSCFLEVEVIRDFRLRRPAV